MSDLDHKSEAAGGRTGVGAGAAFPSRGPGVGGGASTRADTASPDPDPDTGTARRRVPVGLLLVVALVALVAGFLIASLIANIAGKKAEANLPQYAPVAQLDAGTYDPAVWGQNFKHQYDAWQATSEFKPSLQQQLKLAPSDPLAVVNPAGLNTKPNADNSNNIAPGAVSPAQTDAIARDWVTPEKIVQDPRLITMWSGYAFAIDYRHLRGHMYMQTDQRDTLRVAAPPKSQPAACMNCHVSMPGVLAMLNDNKPITDYSLNNTELMTAWDKFNGTKYLQPATGADGKPSATLIDPNNPDGPGGLYGQAKAAGLAQPIGCIDCHDPATMRLRVTRPALIIGLNALKASQGVQNYDVNRDATTQEMRTYVCAQCHVEYYFAPAPPAGTDLPAGAPRPNTLVFPWKQGTNIDQEYAYYMNPDPATGKPFTDFTSSLTGAAVLKAQHPEFECWSEGVHAANGVTCADCHMAYTRVGSQKVSNHDVASPMNDIAGTCGTCHTASETVMRNQVLTIQSRYIASRDQALDALTQFIAAIKAAKDSGTVPQAQIDAALQYQNKASFYVDYGYSENSFGFHAPDYFQRIFMESIDASRQGQLVLMGADPATLG